ncbi:hypothetical protein Tco_1150984, partial [Tanacetum coccineum]
VKKEEKSSCVVLVSFVQTTTAAIDVLGYNLMLLLAHGSRSLLFVRGFEEQICVYMESSRGESMQYLCCCDLVLLDKVFKLLVLSDEYVSTVYDVREDFTTANVSSGQGVIKFIFLMVHNGGKFELLEDELEPSLDAHLQIAPHPNTFCNPSLVNWNWDEVILIPSDDNKANVNEPIALPIEDADVEIAPHHNPFFNPKLLNWNWDDVIVIPSAHYPNLRKIVASPKRIFSLSPSIS